MLDGIFKLLKLEATLVIAVLGLLLKMGIWLTGKLTKLIPSKAHPELALQPDLRATQPVPVERAARSAEIAPVTVSPPAPATAASAPQPEETTVVSSGGRLTSRTLAVLQAIDHGIWVAGVDDFIVPHPRAEDLLEQLDHMMYVAAHRGGQPFSIPTLDTSVESAIALPDVRLDDGFDDAPSRPLPAPDGLAWRAHSGEPFRRMPPAVPRVRKAEVPPAPEIITSLPIVYEEDDTFAAGSAGALPESDGQIWMLAPGHVATRLPPRQADQLAHPLAS